jgi:hypothetical protein
MGVLPAEPWEVTDDDHVEQAQRGIEHQLLVLRTADPLLVAGQVTVDVGPGLDPSPAFDEPFARTLESYGMVTQPGVEITWGEVHVGAVQVFEEAGFTEVGAPTKRRRVMRLDC